MFEEGIYDIKDVFPWDTTGRKVKVTDVKTDATGDYVEDYTVDIIKEEDEDD